VASPGCAGREQGDAGGVECAGATPGRRQRSRPIAASALVGAQVLDLKAQGAPVNFALPRKGAWNAPWYAMVLRRAPHPNAAQLMASFMVTPEGQAAVNKGYGSVLPRVSGTFSVPFRKQKLANLTPQKVQAYQAYWNSLFR
jgi:iron(III) transport system substrate-binding protein